MPHISYHAGIFTCALLHLAVVQCYNGILYPRESETREAKSLDGIWNFRISTPFTQKEGFEQQWFKRPLTRAGDVIPMPVPSSYNDITQNRTIRDYVGVAWYDTEFYVPKHWEEQRMRVVVRFGSVNYVARVYLNGISIVNHTGGHLPFQGDVTKLLNFSGENRLTVAVNNTLTPQTLPQGNVIFRNDSDSDPEGYYVQDVNFDFFNYAGIDRSVVLYAVPSIYIDDITVLTDFSMTDGSNETVGMVNYTVTYKTISTLAWVVPTCRVYLYDKTKTLVAEENGCDGSLVIPNVKLWWPFTMHPDPGYMYTLRVLVEGESVKDVYYLPVGIRTVKISHDAFLINNKPFYFFGVNKHEDANIRGKGLDFPLILKDFNLINWLGANSFRTSHYPYAEEIMDLADAQGIVVIDECPAVGLDAFNSVLLGQHLKVIDEMIQRDKNRPSVVMWSVANEPRSTQKKAQPYFKAVAERTRRRDPHRPITAALNVSPQQDLAGQFLDVVMMNRYYAWYTNPGRIDSIFKAMTHELGEAYAIYKKPILVSEYGADTVPGLHMDPPVMFTEDYQTEFIMKYHQAFDIMRENGILIGELIWNFADFMTTQSITRVVGNKKGIFTRERQPKAAAKVLRCRYLRLGKANITDGGMYCPAYIGPIESSLYAE